MAISAQFCNTSFSIDLEDNLEAEFDTIETTTEVLYEDYGDNVTGRRLLFLSVLHTNALCSIGDTFSDDPLQTTLERIQEFFAPRRQITPERFNVRLF